MKELDQAKGLMQELVEQFGIDNVQRAAEACGIADIGPESNFDSGLFDDDEDIPEDSFLAPELDFEFEPLLDQREVLKLVMTEESFKAGLEFDPLRYDIDLLVPLLMPGGIQKVRGGVEIGADVTAIGALKDGCRYVKVDLGAKQKVKVGGKTAEAGPVVIIKLCDDAAAAAQAEVFKNAYDLTKLREMGGPTKPGGKVAKVPVKFGYKKGNNPIRDGKKPNTWRPPDFVEKA